MSTELSTLCYIEQNGKYLMLHRVKKENDVNKDKWIGPGGHFEPDESPEECLVREVFEETGLTIESPMLCGTKDWVNDDGSRYLALFYKTDKFSGDIRSSEEGEIFWMPLEKLLSMDDRLSLDMKDMIKIFLDDKLSEFFYYKDNGKWEYELK